jgi:hypothetical protein
MQMSLKLSQIDVYVMQLISMKMQKLKLSTIKIESICSLISQKHANVTQIVPDARTSNVIAIFLTVSSLYVLCYMANRPVFAKNHII